MREDIKTSDPKSIYSAAKHIYKNEGGILGFYNGLRISLVRTIPAGGACFVAYEVISEKMKLID
jgi:hypothetical protein